MFEKRLECLDYRKWHLTTNWGEKWWGMNLSKKSPWFLPLCDITKTLFHLFDIFSQKFFLKELS